VYLATTDCSPSIQCHVIEVAQQQLKTITEDELVITISIITIQLSALNGVCVCDQCVIQALSSIQSVYQQRAAKAEEWRAIQQLSLLSDSSRIMTVTHADCVRTTSLYHLPPPPPPVLRPVSCIDPVRCPRGQTCVMLCYTEPQTAMHLYS